MLELLWEKPIPKLKEVRGEISKSLLVSKSIFESKAVSIWNAEFINILESLLRKK